MNNHIFNDLHLWILKVLQINTPGEEEELNTRVSDSPHLQQLAEEMKNSEDYKLRQTLLQQIDVEQELQHFLQKQQAPVRKFRLSYWKAAVIFLLPVSATFIAWQLFHDRPATQLQTELISNRHGTQGATLILSDGTQQQLFPGQQFIRETDGSEIRTDSSTLNYTTTFPATDPTPLYNHLIVGRGFEYMLILQDGTKVWMNSESELYYPVQFTTDIRKIRLSGEAYFEVAKDSLRPFIVEVNKQFQVKVLGTHFNIKAYPADGYAETTLAEGKVAVNLLEQNPPVILEPSEQMVIRENGDSFVRMVNTDHYIAWHSGWFFFSNEPLVKALEQIGRWYNVDFIFQNQELTNMPVTGKLKRFENLDAILDILSTTTRCHFIVEGNQIYVTKK